MENEFGIDLDDAVSELSGIVDSSVDFLTSEFGKDWEAAELYYDGGSDLKLESGRSSLVKTEVRDVIRAILPSVMRTLLHARKPVVFTPNSIMTANFAEQQSHFATQLFYREGGYMLIYSAVLESLKMKGGPVKTYWDETPEPEHILVTGITASEVAEYSEQPDLVVEKVEEHEDPTSGDITYDLRATRYYSNGRIRMEPFPVTEFFVQRNATNLEDFVHGHRRSVKVSEAIEMGLEYDNWRELDNSDPETDDHATVGVNRRGYQKDTEQFTADIMNVEFLLTEAYCKYDMDGDGVPEKYIFYLGGTQYEYLHHERVEDFEVDLVRHDPVPFSIMGRSIVDITKSSQDSETVLLRAVMDNAMMANNPRPAGDPTKVNFNDLMNNAIGAPIRTKGDPAIQYADIPFTAQSLLPFLQYLEQDTQTRVGVTKAATGLDPDAMQSTDKAAVQNTIQLSQGQIELMVRNIIETGLIPIFRKVLRLSMRHMDKLQMIKHKGVLIPVDISRFDSRLVAEPTVGLGTNSPEQKLATLQFIYGEQQKYLMAMGMDNPFTSLSQVFNTLEDMVELGGLPNVSRYFNYIDRKAEEMIAQGMKEQQAKQQEAEMSSKPIDPGRSLMEIESMKSRVGMQEIMSRMRIETMKLQQKAIELAEANDLKRDELAQVRAIELAKLNQGNLNDGIRREQSASKADPSRYESGPSTESFGPQQ